MRAFVGIPVEGDVARALERVTASLEVGRVVAPENFHVTLAFLDDQPEPVLAQLHEQLSEIEAEPFDLPVAGIDTLGGRRPAILVARVAPSPALVALREAVRGAARATGIVLSRERFRPHVTLARFRKTVQGSELRRIGQALEAWGVFDAGVLRVERFALYHSRLAADGARYHVLAEYPLGR